MFILFGSPTIDLQTACRTQLRWAIPATLMHPYLYLTISLKNIRNSMSTKIKKEKKGKRFTIDLVSGATLWPLTMIRWWRSIQFGMVCLWRGPVVWESPRIEWNWAMNWWNDDCQVDLFCNASWVKSQNIFLFELFSIRHCLVYSKWQETAEY